MVGTEPLEVIRTVPFSRGGGGGHPPRKMVHSLSPSSINFEDLKEEKGTVLLFTRRVKIVKNYTMHASAVLILSTRL